MSNPPIEPKFESQSRTWKLPPVGGDPGGTRRTTPGSFARGSQVGGPLGFSSPDTPGMPPPSDKTAWDFMPSDWVLQGGRWAAPEGFVAVTQLEYARLGEITGRRHTSFRV